MMIVDFQHEGSPQCSACSGPVRFRRPALSIGAKTSREIRLPRPDGRKSSLVGCAEVGKKGVCTMCTPWAADRVILVPDWAGVRRFSGERRIFKGWNPVRVLSCYGDFGQRN